MKILVIGANGMIGSTVIHFLSEQTGWEVFGTIRDNTLSSFFPEMVAKNLLSHVDLNNQEILFSVLQKVKPDIVINCAGLTKHKPDATNPIKVLQINAIFPHRLMNLCEGVGAKLIHISTDCVFSGAKGQYREEDFADADDLYGRSKVLGEVNQNNHISLRISTIGHELQTNYGLLEWFLSQDRQCNGYKKAKFSGFPTVTFAQILRDIILPNKNLSGLYHVAADPISKYDLLTMVAQRYHKEIDIIEDETVILDRSLNSKRFFEATGYTCPSWSEMIDQMYNYNAWMKDIAGYNSDEIYKDQYQMMKHHN